MGLLDGLLGNASDVDIDELKEELEPVLYEGEEIRLAFKVIRDKYIFTESRLILIDIQGMTGKKREYLTIPYKSIVRFSVETSGHFDMDSELKIWLSGMSEPMVKEFKGGDNITNVQKALAAGMFGKA
ncbi:PH domain-containing protein [Pontibacterium sp. N1Y112]|uniref:PH domain-containing protein n=1 Tax=Pontibacterium sinense TaxID=2781979 RepID=A0A8J7F8L0_9GAMM|nr:PH domain-containing protein [Pontibacterium sinense]MBE9397120.1 PH domain-containing protein [Pontibacterium sinense]